MEHTLCMQSTYIFRYARQAVEIVAAAAATAAILYRFDRNTNVHTAKI